MARVMAGDEEFARPAHMNTGGCPGGESAMPQFHKVNAALVAVFRIFENLVGFHIEKAHAHRAMAHDPFQMPLAAASAVLFLGIEHHHRMSALPYAFRPGVAAVADAVP